MKLILLFIIIIILFFVKSNTTSYRSISLCNVSENFFYKRNGVYKTQKKFSQHVRHQEKWSPPASLQEKNPNISEPYGRSQGTKSLGYYHEGHACRDLVSALECILCEYSPGCWVRACCRSHRDGPASQNDQLKLYRSYDETSAGSYVSISYSKHTLGRRDHPRK